MGADVVTGFAPRLQRHLGRRGVVLLLLGVLWCVQAFATRAQPYVNGDGPVLLYEYLPIWLRIALWLGCGLTAILIALTLSPERDRHGYTVVIVLPLERMFSFLWGYLVHLVPGAGGYDGGLRGAATWAAVTAVIMVIAGWPEYRPYPDGVRRDG